MSGPRQRRRKTRSRGINRPTRSGKGLRLRRRLPLRPRMPAVLPAAVGRPTPRNEDQGEFDGLFQKARTNGFSTFSVRGFHEGCYRALDRAGIKYSVAESSILSGDKHIGTCLGNVGSSLSQLICPSRAIHFRCNAQVLQLRVDAV
jgi:hypothetical protein